ncbi:MAG: M23 family metallopeptidase [Verrucomicrobiota bacterium]
MSVSDAVKSFLAFCLLLGPGPTARAELFQLPTPNRALYQVGGQERYYVGTIGKPWSSGTFGCVRSGGFQFHEGLDIRCVQRDRQGEPVDPVYAAADGVVVYASTKPALSNYGNYVILRHRIEGLEIYSLYAHLRYVREGLRAGQAVKAGEVIATLGRTANTREGISKERAHLHFELNFFINDRFAEWYAKTYPGQRNDHGDWNGQNLIGIDPEEILLKQRRTHEPFSLLAHVRGQTELCRVLVQDNSFPWLKRYPTLLRRNPAAERDGIAGYEIALTFNGLPFQVTPRSVSEIKGKSKYILLSVNEAEQQARPCRRLVTKKSGRWELADNAIHLLNLLTY